MADANPYAEIWYVNICEWVEDGEDRVEKSMGPMTLSKAERVDRGACVNLNHERFFTVVALSPTATEDEEVE